MGDQGSKGEKGEPGVQGYDGRQGYMGFMGDRGLMGNTILTDVLIEEDGQTQTLEMNGFLNEASIESSLQSKMISPLDGKEIMLQGKNTTSVSALCPYNGYLNSLKFTTHNLSLNRTSSSSKIRENQDGIDVNISNLFSEAGMPYKFKAGCKKMVNSFND